MFGFGKITRDPLSDARTAKRWLESLPAQDPLAIHAALLTELGRVVPPPFCPRGPVRNLHAAPHPGQPNACGACARMERRAGERRAPTLSSH